MVPQREREHPGQVEHQRLARGELLGGGRSAGPQPGAPAARDLVQAREVPLRYAAGAAHREGRDAGELGLGHPLPAATLYRGACRLLAFIDYASGLAEAVHRAVVLDERRAVDYVVRVDELEVRQRLGEAHVLVVGQVALGCIGGHPGLVAYLALLDAHLLVDKVLDGVDLLRPARADVAADVVLVL